MAVRKKRKPVRKKGGTRRKARPLSASVQKTLKAKAKRSKKYTYGQLEVSSSNHYIAKDIKIKGTIQIFL